ncbi:MAG: CbtB domain-containing protein [Tagaea sp.]|jgi:cobalt transporter subunit CbtB|nr:CbtB-domain containing protein [Azospirillum sp.]MCA3264550.1 CbtB-domain containing protein [Azospirillum sp.]MCZ8122007.1 CbtB-domain containing protein [Magnetospirillum sp.]
MRQAVSAVPAIRLEALRAALAAAAFGLFVLAGVGFVGAQTVHDAAHDSRHSFAFPCH